MTNYPPLHSVIVVSILRLYLVVEGQWLVDGSWFYDPMLAIENVEIGGTLIALSIPGLKPLLGTCFARIDGSFNSAGHRRLAPARPFGSGADSPFPKTTVTIGTRPYRPAFRRDSSLELGEVPSYVTYEVNIECRDTLQDMSVAKSPGKATGRLSWPFGLKCSN